MKAVQAKNAGKEATQKQCETMFNVSADAIAQKNQLRLPQ